MKLRWSAFPLVLAFALNAAAQDRAIHVQELIKASACRDLNCFRAYALSKGFRSTGYAVDEGDTLHAFQAPKPGPDSTFAELDLLLPADATDTLRPPTVTYTFYDPAIHARVLKELAVLGRGPSGAEGIPGATVTWYPGKGTDALIEVWMTVAPADKAQGLPGYYQFQVADRTRRHAGAKH